jgi:hypothetical protein
MPLKLRTKANENSFRNMSEIIENLVEKVYTKDVMGSKMLLQIKKLKGETL